GVGKVSASGGNFPGRVINICGNTGAAAHIGNLGFRMTLLVVLEVKWCIQEGKVWEKTFCRYFAGKTEQIIVWIAWIKVYPFLYLENMDREDRGFAVTQAGLFCQQHVFDDHSAFRRGVGSVV